MLKNSPSGEETRLTHVKIEALQAAIPQPHDRILLARVALGLVLGRLRRRQPVQHRQPHQRLRLLFEPGEEMRHLQVLVVAQTTAHARFDVGAAESGDFSELSRHLQDVVQQEAEFALIGALLRVRDQTEEVAVFVLQVAFGE